MKELLDHGPLNIKIYIQRVSKMEFLQIIIYHAYFTHIYETLVIFVITNGVSFDLWWESRLFNFLYPFKVSGYQIMLYIYPRPDNFQLHHHGQWGSVEATTRCKEH